MEKGFDRVERRIESMASKEVLTAEVSRLDQRVDHVESTVETGFQELRARDEERDKAAVARDAVRDKKFAQRMTWTISVVALVWAVSQFFLTPFLVK